MSAMATFITKFTLRISKVQYYSVMLHQNPQGCLSSEFSGLPTHQCITLTGELVSYTSQIYHNMLYFR